MNFKDFKYQHIERWDTDEVQYLKDSDELYLEPKIDGTNGVIAFEDGKIITCSRNRFIDESDDNQGFAKYINSLDTFKEFFSKEENQKYIIYGEYTVKTTYTVEDVYFKKFFIFDVYNRETKKYLSPEEYQKILPDFPLVPFIKIIPSEVENIKTEYVKFSKFLLSDKFEHGEGFVIKDFSDRKNQYGRKTWAKVLFEKPLKEKKDVMEIIFEKFFTDAFIKKEYLKYKEQRPEDFEDGKIKDKLKFKLCSIISNEFIKEEAANIIFKCRFPIINWTELRENLIKTVEEYLNTHL